MRNAMTYAGLKARRPVHRKPSEAAAARAAVRKQILRLRFFVTIGVDAENDRQGTIDNGVAEGSG